VIETDVQMTKDGEIIVCHDGTFDRICETANRRNVKVLDTLSSDYPEFKDEMPLHFSHGKSYSRKATDDKTFITLSEAFKAIPKSQVVHLEIKN